MIGYDWFTDPDGRRWREHQGALLPLDLPHLMADAPIDRSVVRGLLRSRGALLARWERGFDLPQQTAWWHLIKSEPEDLQQLSGNTRSKIRRGMKTLQACPCSRGDVLAHGHAVYLAAYARYQTFEPCLTHEQFCAAVRNLPEQTEFWGLYERESGRMRAFSENLVQGAGCFYVTIWFDPAALGAYASYVLIHAMNQHYLNERGLAYVSDGARNISHQTGIHGFLQGKFGFRRAYARLEVAYRPWMALAVRVLFPWRAVIGRSRWPVLQKVAVVLEQERIRRLCVRGEVDE